MRLLYDHGFAPIKLLENPPRELKDLVDPRIIAKINKYFMENVKMFILIGE